MYFNTRTAGDVKMTSQAYEILNYDNSIELIHSKFIEFSYLLITFISPNPEFVAPLEIM